MLNVDAVWLANTKLRSDLHCHDEHTRHIVPARTDSVLRYSNNVRGYYTALPMPCSPHTFAMNKPISSTCYRAGLLRCTWTHHWTNCRCKAANKRGNQEAAQGNLEIKRFMAIPCVNMPLQKSVMMTLIIVIMQDADNSDNARCSTIKLMVCTDSKYSEKRDNDAVYDDWQTENVTN